MGLNLRKSGVDYKAQVDERTPDGAAECRSGRSVSGVIPPPLRSNGQQRAFLWLSEKGEPMGSFFGIKTSFFLKDGYLI